MGLFNFFKGKNIKDNDKNQSQNTGVDDSQQEFINDMTSNAELLRSAYNKLFSEGLDYSVRSLGILDTLLEQFFQNRDDIDGEMKSDLIAQAGSYIFEVARRKNGGKYYWLDQIDQPIFVTGQPSFEISITAFDKVRMRIENGPEDNIPFYFKGYDDRVEKGLKGDKALIN